MVIFFSPQVLKKDGSEDKFSTTCIRLKGRISEQKAESTASAHVGSAMPGDICRPGASDTELVEPRPVITEDLGSLGPSRANFLNLVLAIDS